MKLYFDGGCKPNPGAMEVGVVADKEFHHAKLGHGTNNEAEWTALLYAMEIAKSLGQTEVDIYGDSKLVICQAKGEWQCKKEELKPFLAEFHRLRPAFRVLRLHHVPRAQNLAGIRLENG